MERAASGVVKPTSVSAVTGVTSSATKSVSAPSGNKISAVAVAAKLDCDPALPTITSPWPGALREQSLRDALQQLFPNTNHATSASSSAPSTCSDSADEKQGNVDSSGAPVASAATSTAGTEQRYRIFVMKRLRRASDQPKSGADTLNVQRNS